MLHYRTGDLLQANVEALVNTVNTVGVMGKGIALQFKEEFPNNTRAYVNACKNGQLKPGVLLPFWDRSVHLGKKLIVNFPTKMHWRQPSRYEYIQDGLKALRQLVVDENIQSIAVPPLGCGNGGLDWRIVKPMIASCLGDLSIDVFVYEPNAAIKAVLQAQESKKATGLTVPRAQLLYLLFAYESMGEDSSLFAANKLAYFLQSMGQPMRLQFKAHQYGPYAVGVEKVLYAMNGVYLKGLEQGKASAFEPLKLNYERWDEVSRFIKEKLDANQQRRLQNLLQLVSGFLSEMPLEILASTAFLREHHPGITLDQVLHQMHDWNERKSKFHPDHIQAAYDQLEAHAYGF